MLLAASVKACIAFTMRTTADFVKYPLLFSCSCKNNKAEDGVQVHTLCICLRAASCPATGQRFRRRPKADLGVCLQTTWILTLVGDSRGSCQIAGPISAGLPSHCDFTVKLREVVGMRLAVKTC